jgi:hypothetical protein
VEEIINLYPQQAEAYKKMVREGGGVVWMRVGTGKTRVGLYSAISLAHSRAIIVVCRRAAFSDWASEVATLQLPHQVRNVEDVRFDEVFVEFTIVLVSEGMLLSAAIADTLTRLAQNDQVGAYIIDEGYLFKNPRSQKHKQLKSLCEDIPTILMSGSIMPARDLVDIYGQVELSGHGKRLAKHLSDFREQFQTGIQGHFFGWYPKQGAYKTIMERIEPFTYIYMPLKSDRKIQESILKVDPSAEQLAYFKELKETAAIEGKFELTNMATIALKAQQISNGWIKHEGNAIEWIDSPKLDRCVALIEEIIADGSQVVVWCAFREDITRLGEKLAHPVATLQSGKAFDIAGWNKGKYKICLATEASGSSVNHFAQVKYGIYFSQDTKWLSLQQSQGRHDRRSSQHNTCFFTFLHTKKSLDSQIYYTVRTSQSVEKGVIANLDVLQWLKEGRT